MRLLGRSMSLLWVAVLACLAGPIFGQTSFTTVVVFGDSLSDTGNIAHLTESQFSIRYPADNQLLGFDYTDGRFTDGTDTQPAASTAYTGVWVEQLVKLFGANVAVKDSLDGGTNYAYGDATTADGTTTETRTYLGKPLSITLNNMGQQVTTYLATNPAPNAQTLYVLWGGGNDLLNAASAGQDLQAAAQAAAANEIALIQRLRAAGATNFLIPNLPPLGAFAASYGAAAVSTLNTASGVFAQALTTGLTGLKQGAMGASLNIYQPDIFTLFSSIAGNPMASGFGDIATAADTVTVSPDTFLIWDGLHPTTTGHHVVAATAANLFSPLVSSSLKVTAPPAAIAGKPVTVSAAVTSSKTGNVPTGLVTLFSGTTVVGSGPLDASGTATITFTASGTAGNNLPLTAVYAGDVVNSPSAPVNASVALLSASVGTTTALTSSSASANTGASVTFTATVTASVATYGVPAGTVSFLDGTTALGTAPLDGNGVATYTTTSLSAGTHAITATYAGLGIFGGSTSAALTETVTAPGFTVKANPTSLTIASGGQGTTTLTITPVGGYTGQVTPACGSLPAHFSCSFASPALVAPDGSTSYQLTIATNATTNSAAAAFPAQPGERHRNGVWTAGLFLPAAFGLLGVGLRRRRTGLTKLVAVAVAGVFSVGILGVAGCGSSNNAPAGTYTVPVNFTAAAAGGVSPSAQTINLQVTVQ